MPNWLVRERSAVRRSAALDHHNVLGERRRGARTTGRQLPLQGSVFRGRSYRHDPRTAMIHLANRVGDGGGSVARRGGNHDSGINQVELFAIVIQIGVSST